MPDREGTPLNQETILVVDDDEDLSGLLREFFEDEGYWVAMAATGDEALVVYEQALPDLVLMDIHMPSMNGLVACQALRERMRGEPIPIVLMTGFNDIRWMTRAFEVGATDYITKPLDLTLLLQRVRRSLRMWQAEKELRESQRLLSTLMSHLPGMAYRGLPTSQRVMTFLSQGALDLTGYAPSVLVGEKEHAYGEHIHPEDRAEMWRTIEEAIWEREPFQATYRLQTVDGEEKYVWEQGQGVFTVTGECMALEGFVVDITERKRYEEALRASETRFRTLIESMSEGLLQVDDGGNIQFANERFCKMAGYRPAELIGHPVTKLWRETARLDPATNDLLSAPLMGGRYETQLETKKGDVLWVQVSCAPLHDGQGRAVGSIWIYTDITKEKRARDALEQAVEEYRQLFDAAHDAILIVSPSDGRILGANSRASDMYGVPQRSLTAMTLQDVSYLEAPTAILDSPPGLHFEIIRRPEQDDERLVEVSQVPVSYEGHSAILRISRDITERQQAIQRLSQAERLAAVGRLAATLAHEINNPLQAIQSHLELMLDFPITEEEKQSSLWLIRREIERLGQGTKRILNLARPTTEPPQAVALDAVLGQALHLLRKQIEEAEAIISVERQPVSPVLADPDALTQVCLNLILNALEALPPQGHLSIHLSSVGAHLDLTFTTHGRSIPAHQLPHIFKPFFSTKGKGTGLGLYISHELVTQYGGTLTAQNLPDGSGVAFSLCLPSIDAPKELLND